MAACVVGREGLNFGCHREFRIRYVGESKRYLHVIESGITLRST